MYPELTRPLLVIMGGALAAVLAIVVFRPVLRRLALRQLSRRPIEAVLVVAGSLLGTAIIVGSLAVGDTLNRSVKDVAYRTLGPVDEKIISVDPADGAQAAALLEGLRADPDVDGLLTLKADQVAVTRGSGGDLVAEPQALVFEVDFGAAAAFEASGTQRAAEASLGEFPPPAGAAVVNSELATSLGVGAGDTVTAYLFGRPASLRVAAVVPARGLAGFGFGATVNRNLFVAEGTLAEAARRAGDVAEPRTVTVVSNRGGVEAGNALTDDVEAKIREMLGPLASAGAEVSTPKQNVLAEARRTGDLLGSMFLFIGSFSIIAGVLLLVNVFVMLTDERRSQLGMLRALGMRRRRLVAVFLVEGSIYALVAAALGVLLGIGVGRAVVVVAARIFQSFAASGNTLTLTFSVSPTSLVNGFAMGFLIAFATVALTSARVSRLNIIAAIRDLPDGIGRRPRQRLVVTSTVLAVLCAAAAVPAVASSSGAMTYLLPALTVLFTVPMLLRFARLRVVTTGASSVVLLWGLLANVARPDVYDDGSTATYIVLGVMITSAAVLLVSVNQDVVLRPLRRLMQRPGEAGMAARLAVTYPTARKFRTGATLLMYSLIVFTLVIIAQMGALMAAGTDQAVAQGSAGYTVRADVSPSNPVDDPARTLRSGDLASQVADVTPLAVARGTADDPGGRTGDPLPVVAIGFPAAAAERPSAPFALDDKLASLGTDDRQVWRTVLTDSRYVLLDPFFGSMGGPAPDAISPGATVTLTDPATGRGEKKIIAGTLANPLAFYYFPNQPFGFPVFAGEATVRGVFGERAAVSSVLVQAAEGVSEDDLAATLQGRFLANGLVASRIEHDVRQSFAANVAFFRLMQGFLALGLGVGITGLGVVMVRAVRERRRTIGVLRALGMRARTITVAFLGETCFVAVEGVLMGAALAVMTSWLLFTNSPAFGGISAPFPVAWATIGLTVGATLVASLLATIGPARRAAAIRPALAVRVAD